MIGERVDREIPSSKVLLDRAHERHRIGMAPVRVGPVRTEGGNLERVAVDGGGNRPVRCARAMYGEAGGGKGPLRLLPGGFRRDVVIVHGTVQERVPHAAPYEPRLVPREFKGLKGRLGIGGDWYVDGGPWHSAHCNPTSAEDGSCGHVRDLIPLCRFADRNLLVWFAGAWGDTCSRRLQMFCSS